MRFYPPLRPVLSPRPEFILGRRRVAVENGRRCKFFPGVFPVADSGVSETMKGDVTKTIDRLRGSTEVQGEVWPKGSGQRENERKRKSEENGLYRNMIFSPKRQLVKKYPMAGLVALSDPIRERPFVKAQLLIRVVVVAVVAAETIVAEGTLRPLQTRAVSLLPMLAHESVIDTMYRSGNRNSRGLFVGNAHSNTGNRRRWIILGGGADDAGGDAFD